VAMKRVVDGIVMRRGMSVKGAAGKRDGRNE
jgi:hypothetical protein